MQIFRKKTIISIFMVFALLMIATPLVLSPTASAHTPGWNIPTYAYLAVSPNPYGIGSAQPLLIVFWINVAPPTAAGSTGDRWRGFTVDVTTPSGQVNHFGPITSDPTGSSFLQYTPTEIGNYTVFFSFPGQNLSRTGPTGLVGPDSIYVGDYFMPSNTTLTFTVNDTPTSYFQEAPLPGAYWERPINENNQFWSVIGGHWLGQNEYGATYLKYNPYGRAPDTAHVMWTYPLTWGGIVGGDHAINDYMSFYSGSQYQLKFTNPIIMYGILYFSLPVNNAIQGNGVTAVDLRTGKTLWTNPALTSVTFGQLYDYESPNQHGTTGNYLWYSGTAIGTGITNPNQTAINEYIGATSFLGATYDKSLGAVPAISSPTQAVNAAGSWIAVDPQTGKLLFNETNVPTGTRAYGPQGEWLIYNIGRPATATGTTPFTYLWQWNNTKLPGNDVAGGISQWLPGITNYNMSTAYDWNVTLSQPLYPTLTTIGATGGFGGSASFNATTGLYTNNPTILRVFPGNVIFGQSSGLQQTPGTSSGTWGTPDPYVLWAINLNSSRGQIGQVLWQKSYQAPAGNLTVCIGPADGETNVATLYYRETMQWVGIDLLTGNQIWGPTASETPAWNFYTGTTGLTNPIGLGYGHLYVAGYGGILRAYNLKSGHIDFTYGNDPNDPRNSTYTVETAYGTYPTQVAAIADGKVYLVEEEHSLNAPAYHGAKTRCVNATTGELLWEMYGMSSWQEQAVADGYYVWFNMNDQRIYCIGPGPSETTVTASPSVTAQGNSVMITGTVTDQSPNQDLKGTAAISDQDQGRWMDYMVTKTIAEPTDVKGVPVTLTALDPNGNLIYIGTVTSDQSGLFKKLWTPEVPGEYTIYAKFEGSKSYGGSSATTAIGITEPLATPAPTEAPPASIADMYFIPAIAGLFVAIIIVGLLTVLMARKRP
ncbi:MAG: hypothetical protein NWE96_09550 [Candidatus Bathyarchaeota archaeon]|nr:hypothetical protein [Candidatus Bathyarchaeota archaeon]